MTEAVPHYLDPQERAKGIGGSEAAAILGIDPYKTPMEVYLSKIDPPSELGEDTEAAHFGRVLEDVLADEYMRRTGHRLRRVNATVIDKSRPWMRANVDRRIVGQPGGYEGKTTGYWIGKQWKEDDEPPDSVKVQCEHYMFVMGWQWMDISVLIAGQDYRIYRYESDADLQRIMLSVENNFWNEHVLKRIPPPVSDRKDAELLFAEDDGTVFTADLEMLGLIEEGKSIKMRQKELESRRAQLEARVAEKFGPQSLCMHEGKKLVSWKQQTSRRISSSALRDNFPDIARQVTVESTTRVMRY